MKVIDAYLQYFEAECDFNDSLRKGAAVRLTCSSGEGNVEYLVSVSFFPHETEDDFRISYDAVKEKVIYCGKGRRSRAKEKIMMETFREEIDTLAEELNGTVYWDRPLIEARTD